MSLFDGQAYGVLESVHDLDAYVPECLFRDRLAAVGNAGNVVTKCDLMRRRQKIKSAHFIERTCSHERIFNDAMRRTEG